MTVTFSGTFSFPAHKMSPGQTRQALKIIQNEQKKYNDEPRELSYDRSFSGFPIAILVPTANPVAAKVWENKKGTRTHVELGRSFVTTVKGIGGQWAIQYPQQKNASELDKGIRDALKEKAIPFEYRRYQLSSYRHLPHSPRSLDYELHSFLGSSVMNKFHRLRNGLSGVQPKPLDEYLAKQRNSGEQN